MVEKKKAMWYNNQDSFKLIINLGAWEYAKIY